jgi:peptidoglycan hydrolase CwlO-like protein
MSTYTYNSIPKNKFESPVYITHPPKNDHKKIQQLESDIDRLQESFQMLYGIVQDQQQSIDSIEENISKSKEDVIVAEKDLKIAESYTQNYLWYFGALAGTIAVGLSYLIPRR